MFIVLHEDNERNKTKIKIKFMCLCKSAAAASAGISLHVGMLKWLHVSLHVCAREKRMHLKETVDFYQFGVLIGRSGEK